MNKANEININPYFAVLLGVLAVSFSSIFIKLSSAPPLVIAFYRLLFAVLIISPMALNSRGLKEIIGVSRRDLVLAVISGMFLSLHFVVWITSLNYTSISSATVLVTMQPLFVILGGIIFLGEKIKKIGLIGAAITVLGSVVIGVSDFRVGGNAIYGDLLAFSGAFFVAVYFLIGRSLRAKLSLFTYVFMVYSVSVLILLAFNLVCGIELYPYPVGDWICFLCLAVIPTILGHTVFNWALKYVRTAVVSVSVLGEPVCATILALFIFGQVPDALQVTGGIIIIAGLYIFIKASVSELQ